MSAGNKQYEVGQHRDCGGTMWVEYPVWWQWLFFGAEYWCDKCQEQGKNVERMWHGLEV